MSFSQNRPEGKGGGGISTSYKTSLKPYVSKVAEDNNGDEFMITRVDHVIPALNIVHIYGQQES